jgi:hypothetical protein
MIEFAKKLFGWMILAKLDTELPGIEAKVSKFGTDSPFELEIRKTGTARNESCRFWFLIELLDDKKTVGTILRRGTLEEETTVFDVPITDVERRNTTSGLPGSSNRPLKSRWACVLSRHGFRYKFNGAVRNSINHPTLRSWLTLIYRWHLRSAAFHITLAVIYVGIAIVALPPSPVHH